jgi:cytochrome b
MTTLTSSPDAAAATEAPAKTRVWDLPTRAFHWTFAACFAGAWLTAESERWRDVHVMLGYTFAGLLAFRLIWGFVGTRLARFDSFLFAPARVVGYVKSLLRAAPEHHLGHNPAGALAIFALLALGLLVAASGFARYWEIGGEWFEEAHEAAASAMLALVGVHLAGVLVSSVMHRENLARAMVTGWKTGRPEDGIASFRTPVGVLLLAAVLGFWAYAASGNDALGGGSLAGEREEVRREQAARHEHDDD